MISPRRWSVWDILEDLIIAYYSHYYGHYSPSMALEIRMLRSPFLIHGQIREIVKKIKTHRPLSGMTQLHPSTQGYPISGNCDGSKPIKYCSIFQFWGAHQCTSRNSSHFEVHQQIPWVLRCFNPSPNSHRPQIADTMPGIASSRVLRMHGT